MFAKFPTQRIVNEVLKGVFVTCLRNLLYVKRMKKFTGAGQVEPSLLFSALDYQEVLRTTVVNDYLVILTPI